MRRLLAATLAALALGGCGAKPPLSSRQLRERAGTICTTASQATDAIPAPRLTGTAQFLDHGMAVLGPELTALRTLHPDGAAAATYREALSSFAAELRALNRARSRLRVVRDKVFTFRRLQHELAPAEIIARRSWTALGIAACLA